MNAIIDGANMRDRAAAHAELACALKLCDESAPLKEGAERMIAMIRRMNAEMDIPETLPGIRREDIPKLAAHAEAEANPLYPVPKLMTRG